MIKLKPEYRKRVDKFEIGSDVIYSEIEQIVQGDVFVFMAVPEDHVWATDLLHHPLKSTTNECSHMELWELWRGCKLDDYVYFGFNKIHHKDWESAVETRDKLIYELESSYVLKNNEERDILEYFVDAIRCKRPSIVKFFLNNGAPIKGSPSIRSPLSAAASEGISWVVESLIEKGADVNFVSENIDLKTPLDYARDEEIRDIIRKAGGKTYSELNK